jgi:hypothetical protein
MTSPYFVSEFNGNFSGAEGVELTMKIVRRNTMYKPCVDKSLVRRALSLVASEFGPRGETAAYIASRASPDLQTILLKVAPDINRRNQISPNRLGLWLGSFKGKPIGWDVSSRTIHGSAVWSVIENPLAEVTAPPPALDDNATPADLLAANLRKALHRQAELLDLPVDPADPRVNRLIADVANQTVNAVVRAQEASLAAKRDDDEHDRAMEALIEERRQKALLAIEKMDQGASSKGRAD